MSILTGCSKEVSEITSNGSQRNDLPVVGLGGTQQLELIHGREGRYEDVGETSRGHGGSLANVVLTWTEATSDQWESLWKNPGDELDNSETSDSLRGLVGLLYTRRKRTYTEQVGSEGPSCLET